MFEYMDSWIYHKNNMGKKYEKQGLNQSSLNERISISNLLMRIWKVGIFCNLKPNSYTDFIDGGIPKMR